MIKDSDIKERLTILILPGIIPFPPNDGGKLCIFGFIDYLRSYHDIHLLLVANNEGEEREIEKLKLSWPEVIISHVDLFQPFVRLSPQTRLLTFIKRMTKAFLKIMQREKVTKIKNPYEWYDIFQTTPFYPHTLDFIRKLESILSSTKFDIIQTELTWMLNLVHLFPVEVKKVFVQLENRADILRDYGVANNIHKGYLDYIVKNTEFLEYTYMARYDAVFVLNESDKQRFQRNLPGVNVYNSPFGILNKDLQAQNFDEYTSENLVFMGSESHYPNLDALKWFLSDIILFFDKKPFKKLFITGTWKDETKKRLTAMDNCVQFTGFVEDLRPYLKNSVSIVPIRIGGGGIRTKILSAMAKGSPVVATPMSAIGISDAHNNELMIAATSKEFASAIEILFKDNMKAQEIIRNAFSMINNKFSQRIVSEKRNLYYRELAAKKEYGSNRDRLSTMI